jgi:hypothetical protein
MHQVANGSCAQGCNRGPGPTCKLANQVVANQVWLVRLCGHSDLHCKRLLRSHHETFITQLSKEAFVPTTKRQAFMTLCSEPSQQSVHGVPGTSGSIHFAISKSSPSTVATTLCCVLHLSSANMSCPCDSSLPSCMASDICSNQLNSSWCIAGTTLARSVPSDATTPHSWVPAVAIPAQLPPSNCYPRTAASQQLLSPLPPDIAAEPQMQTAIASILALDAYPSCR